jgi:hypothetical protein
MNRHDMGCKIPDLMQDLHIIRLCKVLIKPDFERVDHPDVRLTDELS